MSTPFVAVDSRLVKSFWTLKNFFWALEIIFDPFGTFLHKFFTVFKDVSAFEKMLEDDAANKKVPLLVVAVVGSSVFGHNDLVSKLLELRDRYHFWLHLIGLNVAALAISEPQEHLLVREIVSYGEFLTTWKSFLIFRGLFNRRIVLRRRWGSG